MYCCVVTWQVGNTWRTTKDISMEIEATWADVVENLDETAGLARFAGPGGWNDADMLEVTHHKPMQSLWISLHCFIKLKVTNT